MQLLHLCIVSLLSVGSTAFDFKVFDGIDCGGAGPALNRYRGPNDMVCHTFGETYVASVALGDDGSRCDFYERPACEGTYEKTVADGYQCLNNLAIGDGQLRSFRCLVDTPVSNMPEPIADLSCSNLCISDCGCSCDGQAVSCSPGPACDAFTAAGCGRFCGCGASAGIPGYPSSIRRRIRSREAAN